MGEAPTDFCITHNRTVTCVLQWVLGPPSIRVAQAKTSGPNLQCNQREKDGISLDSYGLPDPIDF